MLTSFFKKFNIYILITIALAIRVIWVLSSDVTQTSDFLWYNESAIDILINRDVTSYISNTRNIGTSILIAIHYCIFGQNEIFPLVTFGILSTLQVLFAYLIVLEVVNKSAALLTALLLAIFPEHVLLTNLLGSDVLFSFLIWFGVFVLFQAIYSNNFRSYFYFLLAGVIFGMAHWTRATAPVFVISAIVYILFDKNNRHVIKYFSIVVFIGGFLLIISPIARYNFENSGNFDIKPIHGQQGKSLIIGTFYEGEGRCQSWQLNENHRLLEEEVLNYFATYDQDSVEFNSLTQHEYGLIIDKVYTKVAMQRIMESPEKFIVLVARDKIKNYWGIVAGLGFSLDNTILSKYKSVIWAYSEIWHRLIILLCSYTLLVLLLRKVDLWDIRLLLVMSALIATLSHIFLESHPRYHHMFLPLLLLYIGEYFFDRSGLDSGSNSKSSLKT